jgi:hypothetical protein
MLTTHTHTHTHTHVYQIPIYWSENENNGLNNGKKFRVKSVVSHIRVETIRAWVYPFFLTSMNIMVDLNCHFVFLVFCKCEFFQLCVFVSVCLLSAFFLLLHLFIVKFLSLSSTFFLLHNDYCSNEKSSISCCGEWFGF